MAVLEYLKVLRRRWRVVLACFLVAAATGYVLSPEASAEPEGSGYQSSLTLVPSVGATNVPNLYLAAHLATSPDVAALAAQRLADAGVQAANAESITAAVDAEVGAVTITATDLDEARASVLTEAYAAATIEFLQRITTGSDEEALATAQAELKAITTVIDDLENDLADEPTNAVLQARLNTETARYGIAYNRVQELLGAQTTPPLQVLGTPEVEQLEEGFISAPTDRRIRALLAGMLGLVLGLGLALVVDRLDPRLRERDDVEEALGLPVLGEIPRIGRRARADYALVTAVRPDSAVAEAYRSLRSAITLVAQGKRTETGVTARASQQTPQVLVVTGMQSDEGKTTTVVNLAAALAETDRSVLVIDCDFRKPEAHLYLDAPPSGGLADVFEAEVAEHVDHAIRATAIPRVQLITSGQAASHPAGVLARLSGIIADSRARADVVLIDSSPLLVASDAVDVLQYADAALVASRLGRTTYEQARRARRLLQRADVPVLGIVLTGTPPTAGTPYGQTSRKRAFWSRLATWVNTIAPNQARRESPGASTDETPTWRTDEWQREDPDATVDETVGPTTYEKPSWRTDDWRRRDADATADEAPEQSADVSPNGTAGGTTYQTPSWRTDDWRRKDADATADEAPEQSAGATVQDSGREEHEGEG